MGVVMVGSGNLATHLGYVISRAGFLFDQIYSRTEEHAQMLADNLGAKKAITDLDEIIRDADFYIIAVKDDAIAEVATALKKVSGVVLHTSGSTDISVLSGSQGGYGVLYPLQTFSKEVPVDFTKIPLIMEFSEANTKTKVMNLVVKISPLIYEYNSLQRRCLHLGAVLSCNFTNYLYTIAHQFLGEKEVDFNLLRPLIAETAQKVQEHNPADVQTGPAMRADENIVKEHLELLEVHPDWKVLYRLLSQGITNSRHVF
ncbi:Predicted oxidoreductase, contains short-chain dehydrogenase (SDR) and DUF2520 domains [bacterium A37T11]|nr:Predicted oxidoreductase, contains short-chain dehydrogenase (SDR) and DUF2520 domains [bacterium A37T11]